MFVVGAVKDEPFVAMSDKELDIEKMMESMEASGMVRCYIRLLFGI